MEHPFLPTATPRAEALRWLTIAEKLLSARDLMGSKSFATRARDSDPTLTSADQILAIADTLLSGDRRIANNQKDLYGILRLTAAQGRDSELIATQYRNLAVLLNPQQNKFPFADQAFRIVVEAWSVLSSPLRKSMYDKELAFYLQQHSSDPFSNPIPSVQPNFNLSGHSSAANNVGQPQMHSGGSSGGGTSHFAQAQRVHAQSHVEPLGGGSNRRPENFMSFTSGSNIVFGSGSTSNMSHGHVNKPAHESFSAFVSGNVASSHKASQETVKNKKQKQPLDNYSNASDKASHHADMSENVGERGEDEEDLSRMNVRGEERVDEPSNNSSGSTFWTACPYCYYMYEYATVYADCSMRCQNCKMAFQAVVIPSPPPVTGDHEYFYCWGFLPLGFSTENWEKNKGAGSAWTPFSPMFTCPEMGNINNVNKKRGGRKSSAPRVYVDDDEVFVEISDSGDSDDDWQAAAGKKKKTSNNVKGKASRGTQSKSAKKLQLDKGKNVNVQDGLVSSDGVEMSSKTTGEPSKKSAMSGSRKQPGRIAKNYGNLDLNVECSNEAEEPAPGVNAGNGQGRGEDDNIEGIGFFEGLDEFLSNLPILNVVSDDKAVRAA